MASYLIRFFILMPLAFMTPMQVVQAEEPIKRVLVLHSYHRGLEWTDKISEGITSVLGPRFYNVEVYHEYLDTKRNVGQEYWDNLINLFRAKNFSRQFDLIISTDNNALEFLRLYSDELYPDIPVVFCGVNYFNPSLIEGIKSVTGVVERVDYRSTIELMLKIHPATKKILVLHDQTVTGLAIASDIMDVQQYFKKLVNFEFYSNFDTKELGERLASLEPGYLVYLTSLNRDRSNNFLTYRQVGNLIQASSAVPVYGSWEFYLGKGIVGGVITSGFDQGQQAATMALSILDGTNAVDIPIQKNAPNRTIFDANVMKKYGVDNDSVPDAAYILNNNNSYQPLLRFVLLLLTTALFIFSLWLWGKYMKQKQSLDSLSRDGYANHRSSGEVKALVSDDIYTALYDGINSFSMPVFYKDTAGIYLACNDAFANTIIGLPKESIIGATVYGIPGNIPSELAAIYNAKDIELLNNPGVQVYESDVQCMDGIARSFDMHKTTVENSEGKVTGIIGVMLDVTDKKNLQKENADLIIKLKLANRFGYGEEN